MGCVESSEQAAPETDDVAVSGDQAKIAAPAAKAESKNGSRRLSSIKRKSSKSANGLAPTAAVTPTAADVDYDAVRSAVLAIMDDDQWDDGSYAPLLIRLAWHASGTYSAADGTGGSSGATMRFSPEKDDPENAGLGEYIRRYSHRSRHAMDTNHQAHISEDVRIRCS
jgi:catalase (peroxidase I)